MNLQGADASRHTREPVFGRDHMIVKKKKKTERLGGDDGLGPSREMIRHKKKQKKETRD